MAILGFKPVLEVPIEGESSLEETIKKDFGEQGLARFKEHNVQVEIPLNGYLSVDLSSANLLEGPQQKVVGRVYNIYVQQGMRGMEVHSVRADNVNMKLLGIEPNNPYKTLEITCDLNPQSESARYLRMIFDLSPDNDEPFDDGDVGS